VKAELFHGIVMPFILERSSRYWLLHWLGLSSPDKIVDGVRNGKRGRRMCFKVNYLLI